MMLVDVWHSTLHAAGWIFHISRVGECGGIEELAWQGTTIRFSQSCGQQNYNSVRTRLLPRDQNCLLLWIEPLGRYQHLSYCYSIVARFHSCEQNGPLWEKIPPSETGLMGSWTQGGGSSPVMNVRLITVWGIEKENNATSIDTTAILNVNQ